VSVVANVAINLDSSGAQQQLRQFQQGVKATDNAVSGLFKTVGKLAIALGAIQAVKFVFVKTAELESQTRSLEVLTGSATKAKQIIQELQQLGAVTPFTSSELIDSAKRLQAFGVETDKVVQTTRRLADVSGATGAELQGLVTAYGQVQAKGRLQGEELLQFQERGIALQGELQKMYGLSGEELRKALEKGRISAEAVEVAINRLTEKGGKYANGAIAQSDTLGGKFSTLIDNVEMLAKKIGKILEPTLKRILDLSITVIDKINEAMAGPDKKTANNELFNTRTEIKKLTTEIKAAEKAGIGMSKGLEIKGIDDNVIIPSAPVLPIMKAELTELTKKATYLEGRLKELNLPKAAKADVNLETPALLEDQTKKLALEKQLSDARIQYERQIADFRESTIRRIADMERTLQDQRIKGNFDLQQSQLKLAGKAQYGKDTSAMIAAAATGQDTTMLSAARDSAKSLNDAAVTRRQIEFDSTMKKIQLERTLTDFKKGIEREIGEMQKSYARQVDGILRTAGRSLGELMVEGAKKAKEIMDGVNPTSSVGGREESSGGRYMQGGIGPKGKNQYGAHFHISRSDQADFGRTALDKYVNVNNKPLSSGATVRGGEYGAGREGRSHTGIDYAFPPGAALGLKGGAKFTSSKAGSYGDETAFQTPDGKVYKILHGKFEQAAKNVTRPTGPAAAALQAPAGSRAMQVDAANSIKPYSPATAKLDQETNALKNQETQAAINQILDQQVTKTNELKDATFQVTEQSMAGLKTSIEKSQADQRTLDLIVSGTNPALAAQFAQNEQLNAQNTLKLEAQQASVQKTLEEKGLTAETVFERQNLVLQLDEQISKQPQILEGLNQQAVKQKEINDASAEFASKQQSIKNLVQGIGSSIESGIVGAIDGAITGAKSLQESLSDILKDIGGMLISFGIKSLLGGIDIGGTKIFGGGKATGGPVSSNSTYMVGEKGPELFVPSSAGKIIPADTTAAMARYQRQGGSSSSNSSSDAMGADAAATPVLSMSFETTRFLGQDYVSTDQLQAAMMATEKRAAAAGAKAGAAQVTNKLQQSPAYRRQVGLR
jgi:tape measure domain-containing protein